MAVTLAQYFRRPTTVQYPDRTRVPVVDSLPERYRGFLEVDMDICTGCKACERDCPIDVIAIDVEKVRRRARHDPLRHRHGQVHVLRHLRRVVPDRAQAPGDVEQTKCIRMTREFEGATSDFPTLTFRFVRAGRTGALQAEEGRGAVDARSAARSRARCAAERARDNAVAFALGAGARAAAPAGGAPTWRTRSLAAERAEELAPLVEAAATTPKVEDAALRAGAGADRLRSVRLADLPRLRRGDRHRQATARARQVRAGRRRGDARHEPDLAAASAGRPANARLSQETAAPAIVRQPRMMATLAR